jgi:hypothetical protein
MIKTTVTVWNPCWIAQIVDPLRILLQDHTVNISTELI